MSKNSTEERWSGLIEAAEHNDEEAVKYWVEEKRVPVTTINERYETAAHFAAANDNLSILKYLLRHDRPVEPAKSLIRTKDVDGFTIFHAAIPKGAMNVIKYLLDEYGTEIDLYESVDEHPKNTAIHLAVEYGQLEVLKYLVEEKRGDVNVRNKVFQEPPIFLATSELHFDIVKYLLEKCNVDIAATDWNRNNILHCASYNANLTVPRYLLDDRKIPFDINARNDYGDTYINIAAKFNHLDYVKYFVDEKNADVNIPDIMYRAPLYHAAFFGYLKLVQYLVEHGAQTEMRDDYGRRPVDATSHAKVKKYLKNIRKLRMRNRRSVDVPVPLPHRLFANEEISIRSWIEGTRFLGGDGHRSTATKVDDRGYTALTRLYSSQVNSFLVLANAYAKYITGLNHR